MADSLRHPASRRLRAGATLVEVTRRRCAVKVACESLTPEAVRATTSRVHAPLQWRQARCSGVRSEWERLSCVNENKISDGYREQAPIEVEVFYSLGNVIAKRVAVRIVWLGLAWAANMLMGKQSKGATSYPESHRCATLSSLP